MEAIVHYKLEGGLHVVNIHVENKAYLLRLAWDFSYSFMPWAFLMRSIFLKSKYKKITFI